MKKVLILFYVIACSFGFGQSQEKFNTQNYLPLVYSFNIQSISPEIKFSSSGWSFNSGYGPKSDVNGSKEWFYKSINNVVTDQFEIRFSFDTRYVSQIDKNAESILHIIVISKHSAPFSVDWNNIQIIVNNTSILMNASNNGFPNIIPELARVEQTYNFYSPGSQQLSFFGEREIPSEIISDEQIMMGIKSRISTNMIIFIPISIGNSTQFYRINCVIDKAYIFNNELILKEISKNS